MTRRGVILLEVLVGLAILSMVGVSSVAYLRALLEGQERLRSREIELAAAERVLAATALLTRGELDARIGVREVAELAVWVDRPEPSLFRVGIAPTSQPSAEIVSTLVFRPVEASR